MAGRGPLPKPAAARARRNAVAGVRTLAAVPDEVKAPALPKLPGRQTWPAEVRSWWTDVWASPMRAEFIDVDRHRLLDIAWLRRGLYFARVNADFKLEQSLLAEVRLQETAFGFTPGDRRRLQVTIAQGEAAEDETEKRRNAKATKARRSVKAVPALTELLG